MTSKDEKLCMAVIKNSTVTNINWDGVAKDLGVGTGNAANCEWRRFKAKFNDIAPPKPAKIDGRNKRSVGQMSDGNGDRDGSNGGDTRKEENPIRQQPEKKTKTKGRGRNVKRVTPESDTRDEADQWRSDEDEV
ncbi:hypothetical protein BDZ45DRAFT_678727 [Acephala macrosclerotiorum]|nr:hypothetical protein BDZ45DRAFT_678727 [Acephala macrosclerotiorum]